MNWLTSFLTSSAGRKVIMSLTGLFLCSFLIAHMAGNFALFADDGGQSFNEYAKFMTTFPLIKVLSIGTSIVIILHVVQGILLTLKNRSSRPDKYVSKASGKGSSWASRNMAILGIIILVFLIVHLKSFWFQMKFGYMPTANYGAGEIKDLYTIVVTAFKNPLYVGFYLISLAALAFHLIHGFQSAFQSLGIRHTKYTPIIKFVGYAFAIGVPLGFASQPLFILMFK